MDWSGLATPGASNPENEDGPVRDPQLTRPPCCLRRARRLRSGVAISRSNCADLQLDVIDNWFGRALCDFVNERVPVLVRHLAQLGHRA